MKHSIKLTILKALYRCGDYAIPEPLLLDGVTNAIRPQPTRDEIRACLRDLEARGAVAAGRSAIDDELAWRLTTSGQALLHSDK
jgi:hypothetical protein